MRSMTCVSMLMAWVLIAEFVIDRYGFDQYLPFYRHGDLCPYDFLALAAVVVFWVLAHWTRE
jgi:hypothetical protein